MADPVYLTINEFPGTAAPAPTVVDFNFAGGYISPAHVKAEIFDPVTYLRTPVTVTDDHFVSAFRLSLPVTVPLGSVLRVYRDTPKDQPLVNFTNGARIAENNLDLVAEQAVFVAAEAADQIAVLQVADVLQAVETSASNAALSQAGASAAAASAALSEAAAQDGASIAGGFALAAGTSAGQAQASAAAAAASAAAAGDVRDDLADPAQGAALVATNVHTFSQTAQALAAVDWSMQEPRNRPDGINVLRFIPPAEWPAIIAGTSTYDATAALQSAVAARTVVQFPAYPAKIRVTGKVTLSKFGATLMGTLNQYSGCTIEYTGTGVLFEADAAVGYLRLVGVTLKGVPAVETDFYRTGSVALDVRLGNVSVEMQGAWLQGFETLVYSDFNSYYNKFTDCRFEKFRYGLRNFSTNNLHISGSRFVRFNTAIIGNGVNGPINITRNSFEVFNGPIYSGTGVEESLVAFEENYVEINHASVFPTNFPASGGTFPNVWGQQILFTGPIGSFICRNNEMQIGAVQRILNSTTAIDTLIAEGNNLHFFGTGNFTDRCYSAASVKNLRVNDRVGANHGASGPWATAYSQPVIAQSDSKGFYDFWDCVASRRLFPSAKRATPAMLNGWTAGAADSGAPTAFLQPDGSTLLSGIMSGNVATDAVAFTLPVSVRPLELTTTPGRTFANFTLHADFGGGNAVRFRYFYATGDFRRETTGASLQNFVLDGVVIPPRL